MTRAWLALMAAALASQCAARAACGPDPAGLAGYEPAAIEPGRRVLQVGPGRKLATPAQAARVARDGDVVLVDAGVYPGARSVWPQSRLLIRGVHGRAHLVAGGTLAQGKAIWVMNGDQVVVENLEFSGARNGSGNGAGIRAQGRRLVVRAAYFHDNDMGILSNNGADQEVVVEYSEFADNGDASGKAHNIYVGSIRRFELRHSSSHGARRGHLVKSRARENLVEYNWLADVPAGPSSYELDFARSTEAKVTGNLIVQSAASPNGAMLSYGAEDRGRPPLGRLRVTSNTFVSLRSPRIFIANLSAQPALVEDNVFAGGTGTTIRGPADEIGNVSVAMNAFVDPGTLDFALRDAAALSVRTANGRRSPGAFVPCPGKVP